MTPTTPERKPCSVCGNEYTVTAAGTIRHHFTDNPEQQAGPDSRKCKGAGELPAGATAPEALTTEGSQCRLCKHPVALTDNGRARSHLTPEQTPRHCPGGSDFPLGTYPDMVGTTDGLVATLRGDCEHVPVGQCYACAGETPPTMASQLKATPFTEALVRETQGVGTVLDVMSVDTRAEAEQFMASVGASAVLGLPLDPAPNHRYTDPSGVEWVHNGPAETCQAPDCVVMRSNDPDAYEATVAIAAVDAERAEADRRHAEILADISRRAYPDGTYCEKCDTDNHRCPGCGNDVPHGTAVCAQCTRETCTHLDGYAGHDDWDEQNGTETQTFACKHCGAVEPVGPDPTLPNCPHPETHRAGCGCPDDDSRDPADEWRTPDDLMERMPEDVRALDALRLNCRECGHPVTPLVDHFAPDGRAARVVWVCEPNVMSDHSGVCRDHECKPDTRARLGDLDEGDHFTRRGTLMQLTERESSTSVLAVVIGGPHDGRTGELKNLNEMVERAPCRHSYTYADDGKFGHSGSFCDYCGTEEQETQTCPDETTLPRSSAASTTTTAPAPGSKPPTRASAPAVSPKSESVTPSAPTARAATNSGSAAVTTDQSSAAAAFLGSGRPSAPASPVTVNAASPADAAAAFLAGGSANSKGNGDRYDGYGRYKVTHPDTGKPVKWTRATTFAKAASDTYALDKYQQRLLLLGSTMRSDLRDRAHGKHVRADKKLLDSLADDLRKAAGDGVAANKGTIVHGFTEAVDHAWHTPAGPRSVLATVPSEYQVIVGTYIHLLEVHGLEPIPYLTEFTTAVKQYQVAGTSDNCYKVTKPLTVKTARGDVHLSPGEYVIGDKKSGRSLEFSQREIAIQLGTYAQGLNTSGRFDWETRTWDPDPLKGAKVRTDVGLVVHLPVDEDCEDPEPPSVQGVDTESGWNAAVLCERVRTWRKVKVLGAVMVSEAQVFAPARPEPTITTRTTVHPPSLMDKAREVTSKGEASAVWQEAKTAGMPDAQVDELVAVMQDKLRKLSEPGG